MVYEVPMYVVKTLGQRKTKTVLIIPVINEGERIKHQIAKIHEANPQIDVIIADGGSTDGSLEDFDYLKSHGVTNILIKTDVGKLSAQLRIAFSFTLTAGYEYFITMDGNDKDGPEGIERINQKLLAGYDFVQGSRYIEGGEAVNTPSGRDIAIRFVHAPLISLGAGFHFTDTTNGFRGYSKQFLEDERMSIFRNIFDTYELLAYIPVSAGKLGFKCCEVPVKRAYPMNGTIPTKIKGFSDLYKLLKILIKACVGAFEP